MGAIFGTQKKKRDFRHKKETVPPGKLPEQKERPVFYIGKPNSNSWSVTEGPSINPLYRRIAVKIEDYPLDYAEFEGIVPVKSRNPRNVEIWDKGQFTPVGNKPADKQLKSGKLVFRAIPALLCPIEDLFCAAFFPLRFTNYRCAGGKRRKISSSLGTVMLELRDLAREASAGSIHPGAYNAREKKSAMVAPEA
jgi:DNA polymerase Ligase (LigD)